MKDMKTYMQNRRRTRRLELLKLLGNSCIKCGCTDIDLLDIDHINPLYKTIRLSGKGLDGNWEKILNEIKNCQILCKNCHKIKSKVEKNHKGGQNKIQNVVCGMPISYLRDKCRCQLCVKAYTAYKKKLVGYSELWVVSSVG